MLSDVKTFHALIDPETGVQLVHLVNADDPTNHVVNDISPYVIEIDVTLIEPVTPQSLDAAIVDAGAAIGVNVQSLFPSPRPPTPDEIALAASVGVII